MSATLLTTLCREAIRVLSPPGSRDNFRDKVSRAPRQAWGIGA